MPNFYKVDKMTYSRSDIADIGLRLGKRLDDLEHMIDFERRKNDFTTKEKIQLQSQVNNLITQNRKDE